uniref:Protein broad-minded n=2 Tax=Hucho hucho TaxID=62062 RepID=A0A4W5R0K6_9TELE
MLCCTSLLRCQSVSFRLHNTKRRRERRKGWQPVVCGPAGDSGLSQVHLHMEIAQSGIYPVYSCTTHYVEMLLKPEVPLVFSTFRMTGFTHSQMCLHWLGQCFWNYLDWPEICHYVSTCVVMRPDYQVYMCVAVLEHLQQDILQHTQTQDLQVFLKSAARCGGRQSVKKHCW